jgi:hypothetical protein
MKKLRRLLINKKPVLYALFFWLIPAAIILLIHRPAKAEIEDSWFSISGTHFLIYYTSGNSALAEETLEEAEKLYLQIAPYLGYERRANFWTWEERPKIYIYPDKASYLAETKTPEWSIGIAYFKTKEIMGFADCESFQKTFLPHEITHLIFKDFVGADRRFTPLWIHEGVAQWAEVEKREGRMQKIREHAKDGELLPLDSMGRLEPQKVKDREGLYIRPAVGKKGHKVMFLTGEGLVQLYYLEAHSLVGFLITEYGTESFSNFCRKLRDKTPMNEALSFTYPSEFRNLKELEKKWIKYLQTPPEQ